MIRQEKINEIDPGTAAYYREVAANQLYLSEEEEIALFENYRIIKKDLQYQILSSEGTINELIALVIEVRNSGKSLAKLGKRFNSKKEGHNKKLAAEIEDSLGELSSATTPRDQISIAMDMGLSDPTFAILRECAAVNDVNFLTHAKPLEAQLRKIETTLVRSILMAASSIANRYSSSSFGIDKKDVSQEACIAIQDSVSKYDLDYRTAAGKRVKFITYAYGRADRQVREHIMENSRLVRLPRSRLDIVFLVIEAASSLEGQRVDLEFIHEKVNELKELRKKRKLKRHEIVSYNEVVEAATNLQGNSVSLDHPNTFTINEGARPRTISELIQDPSPGPDTLLKGREVRQLVLKAMRRYLDGMDYDVIYTRYFDTADGTIDTRTLMEVSERLTATKHYNLSREGVRLIEERAKTTLREKAPELRHLITAFE